MNDVPRDENLAPKSDGIDTYEPSANLDMANFDAVGSEQTALPQLQPVRKYRPRFTVPVVLFCMTCVSTAFVGMTGFYPLSYRNALFGNATELRQVILLNWDTGLMYMACVLTILFAHEMGHFIAALIHRIPASLPFFIPLPISFLGTMGAVIGMEGTKADRKQIFDIGIAGPIAGLVVAVPMLLFGIQQLDLTSAVHKHDELHLNMPLFAHWMLQWMRPGEYTAESHIALSIVNPYFIAGWVGLFVTGMNMLPVSQLDGGHVTYTLFKKNAHRVAQLFMLMVLSLMICDWMFGWGVYSKFILMVGLILFIGIKHPPTRDD